MEMYPSSAWYRAGIVATIDFQYDDILTISARQSAVNLAYLSCRYRHDIVMIVVSGSDDIGTINLYKYRDDIVCMDVTIS